MPLVVECYNHVKKYVCITFECFRDIVINKLNPETIINPKLYKKHKRTWIQHGYRSTKYQKGESHGVKDRDKLEAKKLWQKHIGKRSGCAGRWHQRDTPMKVAKWITNTQYRMWVKHNLYYGHYDVFYKKERDAFYGRFWS